MRRVLPALRPGGTFLVVDNVAFGLARTRTQTTRAERGAAGFEHYRNDDAGHAARTIEQAAAGALTLVEYEPTRGKTPRGFGMDPTGRWLIAANQNTSTIGLFSIDQTTGALSPVGDLFDVPVPVNVIYIR